MSVENCDKQAEAREGQVNQELNKVENAATQVEARVDELEKQLSEVLHKPATPPPSMAKEAQEVEASIVPLASRIRNHSRLLQNLGTHLTEMLERLEIR